MLIAFSLPSIDLLLQGFTIWNPAIQTLCRKNREFTLGHVEPTSMLGCVMKLQLASDPVCFGGRKCFLERGRGMRIEIIHHQPDPIRLGKINVDQQVHLLGKVLFGAARGDIDLAPSP
jgi:hypothetical protein